MKKVSRRGFLKSFTATGGVLLTGSSRKTLAKDFPNNPDQYGMLTDLVRCMGCRRCEAGCQEANNLPKPNISFEDKSVFEEKRRVDAQTYTVVNRYYDELWIEGPVYSKVQCNHCEEPACASACLVGALKKSPEGPVIYNEKVCIGCRYCINACPFYIPTYEYSNAFQPKVQKCFMCHHRIIEGKLPGCSASCPVEAITFGKRNQLISLARDRIRRRPNRYIDHIYGEHEAGGTSWLYISGVPFDRLDFPMNLGTTPFPEYTMEFLSFVPLVLVVWPALLGGFHLFSKRREEIEKEEVSFHDKKENQP